MKKIKITESDLYNIIKQVLLEQEEEEEENVWYTDADDFNFRLFKAFGGDSEKFAKYHNKFYEEIVVDGNLDLAGSKITTLPDNLHVGWSLFLYKCKNLMSLPNNLYVGGFLELSKSQITSLPDNLVVPGTIYIHGKPLSDNDELVKEYIAKGYKINRIN
jgi:hypothetical protein